MRTAFVIGLIGCLAGLAHKWRMLAIDLLLVAVYTLFYLVKE